MSAADNNMIPQPMNVVQLVALLRQIADRVEAEDSYEGWINYLMPEEFERGVHEFDVTAGFRVGNSQGQGGFVLIGTPRAVEP